jgi:hypothetical protein
MAFASLAAPRKMMAQAFRSLVNEFRGFGAEFKSSYDWAIAIEMNKLVELQDSGALEPTSRIWQAIEDAARCYCSVRWLEIFWLALKRRFRMQAVICIGLVLCLISLSYIMPKPSSQNTYDNVFASVPMLAFLIVGGIFYWRLPHRYKTSVLLIVAIAAGVAMEKSHVWSPYAYSAWRATVLSLSPLHLKFRTQLASVPIVYALQWTLWYIMAICISLFAIRLVLLCGRAITSGKEFGYGQSAEACAEVIIRLLNISYSISELLNPGSTTSGNVPAHSERTKITARWLNGQRQYLEGEFNGLAFLIRGFWRRAMRDCYKPVGKLIAAEAPRIELFIRHQQAKNALQGNLVELRDSITSILVHAAEGNWHLIGAEEEYANKVVAQRRTRIIRRAILIAVSIGFAVAVPHYMRHYPALYSSIVAICVTFILVELAGLLDPDAATRLDVAGRVASAFKRGSG